MKIQPAIKKETTNVSIAAAIGFVILMAVFFLLHLVTKKTPFDYKVVLAGVIGSGVAVLNFFLMALSVQKVTSTEDQKKAVEIFKTGYRYRMILQLGWVVLAFVLPCFNGAAGLIPLFFPSLSIKLKGIVGGAAINRKLAKEGKSVLDEEE